MLQTNKKRIIQDVASLPAIGNSKYIYHNTADGFFYYWNDVTNSYVELKNLNVLTTVQATPSATGNTTNLNSVFKDASGDTWIVDSNGDAVKAGSSSLFSLPIYSDNIANVTESGTDGQFLYITNTGDEFGVIDEVYVWIGGMWSPYPITGISALWTTQTTDPDSTGNTGTLPRFVENTSNSTKWYIDSTGVAKLIESNKTFAQVVYVNDLPASATIFDLENPPVTNDNSLKNLDSALYVVVSSDPAKNGQTWTSNGITYSTYVVTTGTPFNIANTSIDAGSNKISAIERSGSMSITNGFIQAVNSVNQNAFTMDPKDAVGPKMKWGTTSNASQYLDMGAYNSQNNVDSKNRKFQIFNTANDSAFTMEPTNGFIGISTGTPSYTLDVNGTARIVTTPVISNATKVLVKNPITGQISEQNISGTQFSQTVYFNSTNPSTATIFSLENPPIVNNNALKDLDTAIYIGNDQSTWTSNGTSYSTYVAPASTEWILAGTASTDAGSDKTSSIYRKGKVLIATNSSTQTTPLKDLHLQNGGASLLTSAFGSGQIFSTNDSSGPRFFLEHLTAAVNQKTSVIYTQNGITYLGAVVSDNGSTWIFANPLIINHSTGFVGIRTTTPLSNFEINGSFGANIRSITATTYTMLSDDYTVVMRTAAAVVTLGASVNRRVYNIKNASTGNITFTGHIDNVASATLTIPSGQSRMLQGDGTTWWII